MSGRTRALCRSPVSARSGGDAPSGRRSSALAGVDVLAGKARVLECAKRIRRNASSPNAVTVSVERGVISPRMRARDDRRELLDLLVQGHDQLGSLLLLATTASSRGGGDEGVHRRCRFASPCLAGDPPRSGRPSPRQRRDDHDLGRSPRDDDVDESPRRGHVPDRSAAELHHDHVSSLLELPLIRARARLRGSRG